MKVVIAPDSFKESLAAKQVAEAIALGVREASPEAECVLVPMADGGEGTVAAVVAATAGEMRYVQVAGPLGAPVEAGFGLVDGGRTAVIEMAAASGLELVACNERNPMRATSFGTGELIAAALSAGVERCVVGIGGSATVDGGAGMLQALGARLLDGRGAEIGRGGAALLGVSHIDLSGLDPRVRRCAVEVACDVDNPLVGAYGAATVFGPQKGATPEMVVLLDEGLRRLARAMYEASGIEVEQMPGAGAAGGLGAALVACLGAKLRPGVELVAGLVGLEQKLRGADLVITGEGRIDGQSVRGKAPIGVARLAKQQGLPVIALAGSVGDDAEQVYGCGIDAVIGITPGPISREDAFARAAENLRRTARAVMAVWMAGAARCEAGDPSRHKSSD